MICPICNSKVNVVDTRPTPNNEIYRKRCCRKCGHVFYTIEFEVKQDEHFKKEWTKYQQHYRSTKKYKEGNYD